jgi:deoxyribodipyrimidine photolyase-related protein
VTPGSVTPGSVTPGSVPRGSVFRRALADAHERGSGGGPPPLEVGGSGRRWLYIPYDQLSDEIGPLARLSPESVGIVLVESAAKGRRRPYHRQKLALVLANLRHFALEQAARGVWVHHVAGPEDAATLLGPVIAALGPLEMQEPAERELRVELAPLIESGGLRVLPHEGWLTSPEAFEAGCGARPPWRMDAFYREVRRRRGLWIEPDGRPTGGKWSFDAENRQPWSGSPPAPTLPRFPLDPIKREVLDLVASAFPDHPGALDPDALPATRADAEALWGWALEHALPLFGPFEDAMSTRSRTLFHTRVSGLLNLHRLLPARVVADVVAGEARGAIPFASAEGFVRQVLGWREFVRHVHRATDGFRTLPPPWDRALLERPDHPSFLGARNPLPAAFWGTPSGLHCLDTVVEGVWEEGYGHHITRLMVLSNLGALLDVEPRALSDWFWVAYSDAYDWVVEPNVLGMGTFAVGDLMTTKPYVSGTPYLHRMGDYCAGCAFDPKKNCPITELYWAYLGRHGEVLAGNHRLSVPLASARKRSPETRTRDLRVFDHVRSTLAAGNALTPRGVREARDGTAGDAPPADGSQPGLWGSPEP